MTNAAAASLILGCIMPFIVSIVKQINFPKWANWTITLLLCSVMGTVTVWITGGFDNFHIGNLLVVIAGIFVSSQAAYSAYWKGTVTEEKLNALTSRRI